ncbi:hypothetical protein GVAV_000031 [Gurleya vavrai]
MKFNLSDTMKESSFDVEVKDLNEMLRMDRKEEKKDEMKEISDDFTMLSRENIEESSVSLGLEICRENIEKIHEYLDSDKKAEDALRKKLKEIEDRLDDIITEKQIQY